MENICFQYEKYIDLYMDISTIFLGVFCIGLLYKYLIINILFEKNKVYKNIDIVVSNILYMKIYIQQLRQKIYEKYFMIRGFQIDRILVIDKINKVSTLCNYTITTNELTPELYRNILQNTHIMNKEYGLITYDSNDFHSELYKNMIMKIVYLYDEKEYIFIYNYEMACDNVVLPIPLYDEKIIENFKKDSIAPYYIQHNKEASLYSLFHIDCKRIKSVIYNGLENEDLLNRINQYKGLFNDFGLMYKSKLRVMDILTEMELKYLESLEIEFEAPYFDEITFDIIPHIIRVTKPDDYIISERIQSFLEKRNKID